MIGQAERQLEGALGDALVQIGDVLTALAFAATDGQHAALDLQFQIGFLETRSCYDDAVLIITVLFNVVGWKRAVRIVAQGRLEQIVETIEANGLAKQWSHRKTGHLAIS